MYTDTDTQFALQIDLGNEAMQNQADVADALRKVAERLDEGTDEGKIMDDNGNTVGSFDFYNG